MAGMQGQAVDMEYEQWFCFELKRGSASAWWGTIGYGKQ